jgi:hypothetical protein
VVALKSLVEERPVEDVGERARGKIVALESRDRRRWK